MPKFNISPVVKTAPVCDSVVGQIDKIGFERMLRAAELIPNVSVEEIDEPTFIEHLNCHSQRGSDSPALGIPANQHILIKGQIAYMITWPMDKPNQLVEFWEKVESV